MSTAVWFFADANVHGQISSLIGVQLRAPLSAHIHHVLTWPPGGWAELPFAVAKVARVGVMLPEDLPVAEFAFPGALRDQLVSAILAGAKTTTTGLVADYEHEGEPLPQPGLRQAVVDSAGHRVAVIETTAVRVIRLGEVDLVHAVGEGEGYTSVAEWRAGHEQFWHSEEMRKALGDPGFTVNDDTFVVAQTFRLVEKCDEK